MPEEPEMLVNRETRIAQELLDELRKLEEAMLDEAAEPAEFETVLSRQAAVAKVLARHAITNLPTVQIIAAVIPPVAVGIDATPQEVAELATFLRAQTRMGNMG